MDEVFHIRYAYVLSTYVEDGSRDMLHLAASIHKSTAKSFRAIFSPLRVKLTQVFEKDSSESSE